MTGIKPHRAILQVLSSVENANVAHTIERTITERACRIIAIQQGVHDMHNDVYKHISDRHCRAIDKHNVATDIVTPNFEVGDFVVIWKARRPAKKLSFSWYGQCHIHSIKSLAVCIEEDLNTRKHENVHHTQIKKYCGLLHGSEVFSKVLDLADQSVAKYKVVENIYGINKNHKGLWLRLQREGLPDERDSI